MDFNTFNIAGPSTSGVVTGMALNGNPGAGVKVTPHTQCLEDSFSVTNPGGIAPPTICGLNTGQHSKNYKKLPNSIGGVLKLFFSVYIDAGKPGACNDLVFMLGTSTATTPKQWSIKVTKHLIFFKMETNSHLNYV